MTTQRKRDGKGINHIKDFEKAKRILLFYGYFTGIVFMGRGAVCSLIEVMPFNATLQ